MKNKFFYFAIVPGLLFQFIGAYLYLVAFKGQDFSQTIYFATKILLVVWPLCWLFFMKDYPFWNQNLGASLKRGLISGVIIVLSVLLIYFANKDFWAQFAPNLIKTAESLNFLKYYFVFAFFLSIFHSFIEEYYWRWFILNGLTSRMSNSLAVIISSLAFASHHFIVVSQLAPLYLAVFATVAIFFAGVYWSLLYLKTKNITGAWVSHFFADAVVMTVGYFLML